MLQDCVAASPTCPRTTPSDNGAPAGRRARARRPRGPRELSVEELLDLEQQADFFIALGQEDAAIDMLMAHLRSAGGQSPLPYTKLLEIFRRQGDRAAYERTRRALQSPLQRLRARLGYRPGFGPRAWRTTRSPSSRSRAAWIAPIDAMAILESLLFRRDESSETVRPAGLPRRAAAVRIARDLWQHGAGAGGSQIDVLLPMDPSGVPPAFEPTARGYLRERRGVRLALRGRPSRSPSPRPSRCRRSTRWMPGPRAATATCTRPCISSRSSSSRRTRGMPTLEERPGGEPGKGPENRRR
jgi:hypothetical protein